jgi:mannitol-specific phosphotransferase system IIBC component
LPQLHCHSTPRAASSGATRPKIPAGVPRQPPGRFRTGPQPSMHQSQEVPMAKSIAAKDVKTIIFACEAGMGSSLMSVNSMKKKLKAANLADIAVMHMPAREIPATSQLVVVHKGLAKVAAAKATNAVVLTFHQFLDDPVFDQLVKALVDKTDIATMV